MELERLFDAVVFGKAVSQEESCLGIYISPETVYLAEVRLKNGRPAADHLLRVPLPQAPEPSGGGPATKTGGSLNTETLANPDRLVQALKPALDRLKPRSLDVVVSLSHQFGLLRYFTIPPMDRRYWRTAVPAEAKKHVPIPFEEIVFDFQVQTLPGAVRQPRHGVLFGVIHRRNLEGLVSVTQKLGLALSGVELAPCSVERLWDSLAGPQGPVPSYAHVHLEGADACILVSQNGWPILSRAVQISPEAAASERRKVDLAGSVDFTRKQLDAKAPTQIRVSGTSRDLQGWVEALSRETEAPVRLSETAKGLGLEAEEWGAYACVGGALRRLAPSALVLDLSRFGRISEEDKRAVYTLFAVAGTLAAFFALAGMLRYSRLFVARGQLARLRAEVSAVPEFRGKGPSEIERMIKDIEAKADSIGALVVPKLPLTRLFELVAEDMPDAVWLTQMTYSSPLGEATSGVERTLALQGHAAAASPAMEQDLATQFRERLQGDDRFGKTFSCGTPFVQAGATEVPAAGAGALSPEQSAQQELRTNFSLNCSSRAL